MTAQYLLGIDSGTSVVKSVIFDLEGREVAIARRETPVICRTAVSSEVDMLAVWRLTAQTVTDVIAAVGGAAQIGGVGVCGTCCGVWAVDDGGHPVRDALLWNDGRAADVIAAWGGNGFARRVWDVSANVMFPGYRLVALRWLADHEPETLARTRWILHHKEWLLYQLTSEISSDESDAGYFPGDLRARGYSDALLEEAGLGHLREKLPPVVPSHQVVGAISEKASALTGLRAGTPVVAGAVDVVASTLGGGAYKPGQACSILGTSFLNTLVSAEPTFEPAEAGVQTCMPEGRWARSLVNTTGTLGIEWMVRNLAEPERREAEASGTRVFDLIEAQVMQVPIGARGIMFLPYLNSAGIISPFVEPHARGQFFGLSVEHTRFDMMRAVYEGIALAMRDCYAAIPQPVEEVRLVGGGARSAFWAQMFADASGKRILVPGGTEFGARGAAILAGVGTGAFGGFDQAMAAFVRPDQTYTPDPLNATAYARLYDLYRHLYQNDRASWALRHAVMNDLS